MNPTPRPPGRETTALYLAHLLTAFGKWILEPDRLPPAPLESSRSASAPKFSVWLESRDPLPLSAAVAPRRKRFLSWLVSSEPMPDPATKPGPSEESILGWLLSREKLTTNQPTRPTKEVSIHGS